MGAKENNDWSSHLLGHPIFSRPTAGPSSSFRDETAYLELSTSSLSKFASLDTTLDNIAPSGRRQVMLLKDTELLLAVGKEIRMATVMESKVNRSAPRTYKTLHTPNIQFEIHQMSLNPSGTILAVTGAYQVAIVVLPRAGYARQAQQSVDCKALPVGPYYHAPRDSAPIAKVAWHPWGESGSTLLVMTADGKMREYDISVDTEEPQQVLSFAPERRSNTSFIAEDASEHEVASFTLGQGKAHWGPLTMYALMKSGDVYAICPYMPKNASIPSFYIHALECHIIAKQEFLAQAGTSAETRKLSAFYDYQHKYVTALIKQLPPGTEYPAVSRSVLIHPPSTIRSKPLRQGPFLLQPSPRTLEGSEGGDATDIFYLTFASDDEGTEGETERLGIVLITHQDGRVDVCMDVENVDPRWEKKHSQESELPMLAVYETIDLGLIDLLQQPSGQLLDLLQGNHPVLFADPIHEDTVYVYHAFGVHVLQLGGVVSSLAPAFKAEEDEQSALMKAALEKNISTTVVPVLSTFSVERRCSNPVVSVAIPNDVYLTYSILILTSSMRITCFPLNLRTESPVLELKPLPPTTDVKDVPHYTSLLETPFQVPKVFSQPLGLPSTPRLSLGPGSVDTKSKDFLLTPDVLRFFTSTVQKSMAQIHDIQIAFRDTMHRQHLQKNEWKRQQEKLVELTKWANQLTQGKLTATQSRIKKLQEEQTALLSRTDRIIQALLEQASPGLSDHEKGWFEELQKMRSALAGEGKYDEESLVSRTASLEREYERLLPRLQELRVKESDYRRQSVNGYAPPSSIGQSQAHEINKRSNQERKSIEQLQKKLLDMASSLELSLAKPVS